MSDAEGKAPSYYEESEYGESEYESEEDEHSALKGPTPKRDGWLDGQPVVKKDFDPRTDKMIEIDVNEDFLMDSLKNFKPPEENSLDKS